MTNDMQMTDDEMIARGIEVMITAARDFLLIEHEFLDTECTDAEWNAYIDSNDAFRAELTSRANRLASTFGIDYEMIEMSILQALEEERG